MDIHKKPMFTRKHIAEFNTGQDTLEQIATLEWRIDELVYRVYQSLARNGKDDLGVTTKILIQDYYTILVKVYRIRLRTMMYYVTQEEDMIRLKEVQELYTDWLNNNINKNPVALLEKLDEYREWLGEIKQKRINLGVPMRQDYSAKERLNKAAGV